MTQGPLAIVDEASIAVWQARVAVPAPLGQTFSYLVPEELRGRVRRGARVLCELARRRVLGVGGGYNNLKSKNHSFVMSRK